MNSFDNIVNLLPVYLKKLFEQKDYSFADLTERKVKDHFNTSNHVSGIHK